MNLKQLHYFVILAEELHFGRAAHRLNMTQPPLSLAIKALEADLDVKLFDRTKRHVALTPAGSFWLKDVRLFLKDADRLQKHAQQAARGEIGSLNLGFVSTAVYNLVPDIISRYRLLYPNVKLNIKEMTSDIQLDALRQNKIDAGFIIRGNTTVDHDLSYARLIDEPLVIAIPSNWIATGRFHSRSNRLEIKDISGYPLIIFPRQIAPVVHDAITELYTNARLSMNIVQEAIQMQTIACLVSKGMGIALVPKSLVEQSYTGIKYFTLAEGSPCIETGILWRHEKRNPLVENFLKIALTEKSLEVVFPA